MKPEKYTCKWCKHSWWTRKEGKPIQCPGCMRRRWQGLGSNNNIALTGLTNPEDL